MRAPRRLLAAFVAAATAVGFAGCTTKTPEPVKPSDGPSMLRVLASSEVADLEDAGVLEELKKATGVEVSLTESGTLDASSAVANGEADGRYDAVWLSSNRYFSLLPGAQQKAATSTKIMASPVVLGVRPAVAKGLGWSAAKPPTWAQIQKAAAEGKLTYAMTNPAASNSGFSTLVAVTTGLAGGGAALDAARTTKVEPQLKSFFGSQRLTAGSTGWITDKFINDPTVGGLFSYEASLLALNASGRMTEKLEIIAPSDGVITADYPLTLLSSASSAKRDLYTKAVEWLKSPAAQKMIMERTSRRPLAGGVKPDAHFPTRPLVEMPFPADRAVVDALVSTYLNKVRRAPVTVYVLDVSGSMSGDRIDHLKNAMKNLTKTEGTNSFVTFHAREDITLLPFSSQTRPAKQFVIPEKDQQQTLDEIGREVDGLEPDGGTSMYEALIDAYGIIEQRTKDNPDAYATVVLLTDGEANGSKNLRDFESFIHGLPESSKKVPTFTIRFGDANTSDLTRVAEVTGGRAFDGTKDLTEAFRTIRGYQ